MPKPSGTQVAICKGRTQVLKKLVAPFLGFPSCRTETDSNSLQSVPYIQVPPGCSQLKASHEHQLPHQITQRDEDLDQPWNARPLRLAGELYHRSTRLGSPSFSKFWGVVRAQLCLASLSRHDSIRNRPSTGPAKLVPKLIMPRRSHNACRPRPTKPASGVTMPAELD